MKRFLLWIIGVILGVVVLLGAVMAVSYSFTGEGSRPEAAAQFGGQELEVNGSCWQVPLVGGVLDKVFAEPETLSVQKLGVLYDAHPALTMPDWATYTTLTIQSADGAPLFTGSASEYDSFLFPANGEYKAQMTVWRLPAGGLVTRFEGGSNGAVRKNSGLEHPAKPSGWYSFSFRFTLQASANVELSAERVEQGGIVGVAITGMVGETAPTVETDLGSVQCTRSPSGWRAYIPAAYNASAGAHDVTLTVNGEVLTKTLTVLPKDFGTAEVEAEPAPTEAANTEFRNSIWPLYEQPAQDKLWSGRSPRSAGFRPDQDHERPAGFQVELHQALHHPRRPGPRPRKRHGGLRREPRPHRQHRRHRPRLRDAQLPLRPADPLRHPRPDR